jgi:hypothetical protein
MFDNTSIKTSMQALYRGTYWLCQWAQLQKLDEFSKELMDACKSVELIVMQVFASHGWRFSNQIAAPNFCFSVVIITTLVCR